MDIVTIINNENNRTIEVQWPVDKNNKIVTIDIWAEKNLTFEELDRWKKSNNIHQETVEMAIKNGDASVDPRGQNTTIQWKSVEIHKKYMLSIDETSTKFYHEVWKRFQDDRNSISASSY